MLCIVHSRFCIVHFCLSSSRRGGRVPLRAGQGPRWCTQGAWRWRAQPSATPFVLTPPVFWRARVCRRPSHPAPGGRRQPPPGTLARLVYRPSFCRGPLAAGASRVPLGLSILFMRVTSQMTRLLATLRGRSPGAPPSPPLFQFIYALHSSF